MSTKISWTNETWNTVTGCQKVSAGCARCYAATMTRRLKAMGQEKYQAGFSEVVTHPECLGEPYKLRKPSMVFVNSMSDTFHKDVPVEFIQKIFSVAVDCPRHTFQVLTKRSERLVELAPQLPWPANVWMGVSVENERHVNRIDHLRQVPAAVRFLSIEPLLGPIPNLNLDGIDWVIVGGESGPGSEPVLEAWVVDIRDQCREAGVAFFFKQWGGRNNKKAGHLLLGETCQEMPDAANVVSRVVTKPAA
ncbi:MAG: phage Gp37/Gp68 family protein [Proteobacteria bacterium]|jgi:protein gp37|nr:phage Gp37/Gp68 family protein [Pseudomonadota bacterium]